jgi:hypothetical protein
LEKLLKKGDYAAQVARYRTAAARLLGASVRSQLVFLNVRDRIRVVDC